LWETLAATPKVAVFVFRIAAHATSGPRRYRHTVAEVGAEFFRYPHRPHRAPGAEHAVWKLGIPLRRECVPREFCAKASLQVLSAPMGVAPFRPAMHEGIAQCYQAVGIAKGRSSFVERLGVSNDQRELVFVQDWRSCNRRPEVCRYGENATAITRVTVHDVILDFQVQFVDGRFQKGGRRQYCANDVCAVPANNIRVRRGRVFLFELAGEVREVTRRKQVMPIETGRNLFRRGILQLWRDIDRRFAF
jgi:hypothetical protein